jgi:hypothetical protein
MGMSWSTMSMPSRPDRFVGAGHEKRCLPALQGT